MKIKSILSLVLAIAMTLSLCGSFALAEETAAAEPVELIVFGAASMTESSTLTPPAP